MPRLADAASSRILEFGPQEVRACLGFGWALGCRWVFGLWVTGLGSRAFGFVPWVLGFRAWGLGGLQGLGLCSGTGLGCDIDMRHVLLGSAQYGATDRTCSPARGCEESPGKPRSLKP